MMVGGGGPWRAEGGVENGEIGGGGGGFVGK